MDFTFTGPDGNQIFSEYRKMDGLHSFDVKTTGEHSLCFSNEFSRVTHKMIYFDVIIEDDSGTFTKYTVHSKTKIHVRCTGLHIIMWIKKYSVVLRSWMNYG